MSLVSCYHPALTHSSGPPTRDPPVLTPTLVLSLRVPLCDRQKDRWLACGSTATSASSSPARLVTLVRQRIVPRVRITMFGRGPSSNINSDLYQDHGGIIHEARGLNVNIALKRPCCFSEQRTCICCHHLLLEYCFDDRFGGIVRN